ncbi:Rab GTPase-activating protein 1 [Trichoplax sp. H2]|nr:Rab GTPase-activating protein 1 [Trichoplax sp. H2]|eukprot:RDD44452.1 Rab GTPase-activating protein 1 [Trichoplax sp. H2]
MADKEENGTKSDATSSENLISVTTKEISDDQADSRAPIADEGATSNEDPPSNQFNMNTVLEPTFAKTATNSDGPSTTTLQQSVTPEHLIASNISESSEAPKASKESETQDTTYEIFEGLTCLGSSTVNAPKSETEAQRVMATMRENSAKAIEVNLSVPSDVKGSVALLDPITGSEICSYPVTRILFCARGNPKAAEKDCFSFSSTYQKTEIFYIHVFQCTNQSLAEKVLKALGNAFRNMDVQNSPNSDQDNPNITSFSFQFDITLDVLEKDEGIFRPVPRESGVFKIRENRFKQFSAILKQISGPTNVNIIKCMGLLLCPGPAQLAKTEKLFPMNEIYFKINNGNKNYEVIGVWNPETLFNVNSINAKTPKGMQVYATLAMDVVFDRVLEPVRLLWDIKLKVYERLEIVPESDRMTRHSESFMIQVKKMPHQEGIKGNYRVTGTQRICVGLSINNTSQQNEDLNSGNSDDETVLSGSGNVQQDCSDNALIDWSEVLTRWTNTKSRPKELIQLVRKGIPEPLRGQVWQMLAGIVENTDLLQTYSHLLTKESPSEKTILVDLGRTFPAHPMFKDQDGEGQSNLYRICKMPEEQAFCVLVKIMYTDGLRDLFRLNFEQLHIKFFQLEKLLEVYHHNLRTYLTITFISKLTPSSIYNKKMLPDLYYHFQGNRVEAHMYASQWFLTLFTAKFPLAVSYHVMDMFLCEGMEVLFRVAITILKHISKELLLLDFEGIMKHFRVTLPKKCLSEEFCSRVLLDCGRVKIDSKKLRKYEKEYYILKELREEEDPVMVLEEKNRYLMRSIAKTRQENESLGQELTILKTIHNQSTEEAKENMSLMNKELTSLQSQYADLDEDKRRLQAEIKEIKELYRDTVAKSNDEANRQTNIVKEYKQICSQLQDRLEKQENVYTKQIKTIKAKILKKYPDLADKVDEEIDSLADENAIGADDKSKSYTELGALEEKFRKMEVDYAHTKLELVAKECKIQELEHQLSGLEVTLAKHGSNWFAKWKK